ncbi:MAG: Stf0 family sulfotransferase [Pseudomonadota bacterium]
MTADYFSGIAIDAAQRDRIRALPEAEKTLVVFFTPRSGSSWLADILAQSQGFGRASELFNPNFIPKAASALQSDTLDDYIYAARRRLAVGGVFSFEITMHQLNVVFEGPEDFHQRFGNSHMVWLVRRDIVAQAVSLAKMVNVKIDHSPRFSDADVWAADREFSYSNKAIANWIRHIRRAEIKTEEYFFRHGIRPLRLVYESMTNDGPLHTLRTIASHTGVYLPEDITIIEQHRKIGTRQNEEFAAIFRRRNWIFVKALEWQRRGLMSQNT